jgi:low affinity Fe/Cu permease
MVFLSTVAAVLVALVGVLIWYSVLSTKQLLSLSEDLESLSEFIEEYRVHLETIYNMETFYGEPIIQNLIAHTKDVEKQIKKFKEIYSLSADNSQEDFLEEDSAFDEEKEE